MKDPVYDSLRQQSERLRGLLDLLLSVDAKQIPPLLTATLFDFYIATSEQQRGEGAGQIARSLASLLHRCGERSPDEQERLQLTVLAQRLLQALTPADQRGLPEIHRPLVTPIAPSLAAPSQRIVLYIDNAAVRVMLETTLHQAGFAPFVIDTLDALVDLGEAERPAAIIADLPLCQMHPQADTIFSGLRRRFTPPPHLFCIAPAEDIPARLDAVRLGATRFFAQPIDVTRLLAVLRGVTALTPVRPFRVLAVDDDPLLGQFYAEILGDAGLEVRVLDNPLAVPEAVARFEPDVIVTDIFMPGCNGFELLALLRQDENLTDTPIVLLSSDQDPERRMEALDLGADDYLGKPVDGDTLVATVIARAKRARMLKRSRGEYRRVVQRLQELERTRPNAPAPAVAGELELHPLESETINIDDYVVGELRRDER